ncbi:ParA family protein [Limisalsivibrio acetivorans]|uniref:ParA family protein n=1 Tax=Limisalsivibrio acetivorans TaxID=1304888 RepID=UPI0003B717E7|nr:AAA family ATPase [Limisalsivibrio acetivorans]
MKTIAVYSIKGGVGKTAASVNLAYYAAKAGKKVLIWDLDPQAAATFYFRVKPKIKKGIKKTVQGKRDIDDDIKATDYENLDIIPSDFSYRKLDIFLDAEDKSKKRIGDILKPLQDEYDVVILDAPPGITLLSEALIQAADILAVPIIPTVLSQRTSEMLTSYLKENDMKKVRPALFFSMVDRRKKIHREVMEDPGIKRIKLLESFIPYSADVERMGTNREPVGAFSPWCRASRAYKTLWEELEAIL